MSLLSETLSRAKEGVVGAGKQVGARIQNSAKTIASNVKALPDRAAQVGINTANRAVDVGVSTARGAAMDLIRGDTTGAANRLKGLGQSLTNVGKSGLTQLGGLPVQAINSGLSDFGFSLGGGTLSGPGLPAGMSVSSFSSDGGGVPPGNALAGALARTDPLLSFLWYCVPPTLIGDGVASDLPWYFVEEANLPFRTYDTRQVYREGRPRTYASKYSVSDLSLTFYLDVGGSALNYLKAWNDLIVAPFAPSDSVLQGGQYRMPSQYKKDIQFYLLNVNKQELVQIIYTECWPTNINSLSLQSQTSERLVAQVNFSVGDVFIDAQSIGAAQMDAVASTMTRPTEGVPARGATSISVTDIGARIGAGISQLF